MTSRKSAFYFRIGLAAAVLFGLAMPALAAWATIHNDFFQIDQNGNPVGTRSGCLRKFGNTYYWYGSANSKDQQVYTSADLMHWTNQGVLFTTSGSTNRMDVVYNDSTQQYVMVMKYNDSSGAGAHLGIATSTTPTGKFTLQSSGLVFGSKIGDMSVYQDADGKAYLCYVWDSIPGANSGGVSQHAFALMSPDYLSLSKRMWLWNAGSREGPSMMKSNGLYYFMTSLTLWTESTATQYYTASNLAGPWTTTLTPMITPGSTNSWDTQNDFVFPIQGTQGTVYMYDGDRWIKPNELRQGDFAWLPITFSPKDSLVMNYYQDWEVELDKGLWRPFDYSRNLALHKTATASSSAGGNVANNVTDSTTYMNFTNTRWTSTASDPQWIQVDLGSAMSVNRVILKWDTAYAKAFQIQVSTDAAEWTNVFTTTAGGKRSVTDETFPATTARYVRMYGTQRGNTALGYSLFDFAVLDDTDAVVAVRRPDASPVSSQTGITYANNVLSYKVPASHFVKLAVVDGRGKQVAVLVEGDMPAGRYQAALPATLGHGVYLVRLTAGAKTLAALKIQR